MLIHIGLGGGLGRIEFDDFRLAMGESRRRFAERSGAILAARETGYIEHRRGDVGALVIDITFGGMPRAPRPDLKSRSIGCERGVSRVCLLTGPVHQDEGHGHQQNGRNGKQGDEKRE